MTGKQCKREEKVVGFSSASLFPTRKWKSVAQGGTRGIDYQTWRRMQGAGIVKGWEDKRDHEHIQDTFTENKNNMSTGPLTPKQLNPGNRCANRGRRTEWKIEETTN